MSTKRSRRTFPALPGQRGLATSAQLRDAGWSYSAIKNARKRDWQVTFPGVFAPHRGELDDETWLLAAALWVGHGGVLTGLAALVRLDMAVARHDTAIFLLPDGCRARTATSGARSVRAVRTARPVRVSQVTSTLVVAHAARALVDAVVLQSATMSEAEHLTIAVLQRGLCSPEDVDQELMARPRAAVAGVVSGVEAFRHGAWSRPEAVLRQIFDADPELPELLTNVALTDMADRVVGVPDGYLPSIGAAVQVHSRAHHQGTETQKGSKWAATVEKDGVFGAVGIPLIPVTPWTLYADPASFVTRVKEAVRNLAGRPPPPVKVRRIDETSERSSP